MGSMIFVQDSGLFSYSGTNCIRNDYYHNECKLCVDICPKGAFDIVRGKLMLSSDLCVECAACIGSCPTEALSIKSFDSNAFSLSFKDSEDDTLSCKKNTSCLGVFDAHHYITMALRGEKEIICDMAHCADCALNVDRNVEGFIRDEIRKTQEFLSACGVEASIVTKEEKPEDENPKRMLFRKAFVKIKEASKEEDETGLSLTLEHQKSTDFIGLPLKFLNLKKAIRESIPKLAKTTHDTNFGIFANKVISFKDCTNCGDCVNFCPTEALLNTKDKQGINFNVGNCISCDICDHICKTDAIKTEAGIDLVSFAYDRGKELVHYEMVMCHECRCPYPYRGGDPICDRCANFQVDFSHVFTLARDS